MPAAVAAGSSYPRPAVPTSGAATTAGPTAAGAPFNVTIMFRSENLHPNAGTVLPLHISRIVHKLVQIVNKVFESHKYLFFNNRSKFDVMLQVARRQRQQRRRLLWQQRQQQCWLQQENPARPSLTAASPPRQFSGSRQPRHLRQHRHSLLGCRMGVSGVPLAALPPHRYGVATRWYFFGVVLLISSSCVMQANHMGGCTQAVSYCE